MTLDQLIEQVQGAIPLTRAVEHGGAQLDDGCVFGVVQGLEQAACGEAGVRAAADPGTDRDAPAADLDQLAQVVRRDPADRQIGPLGEGFMKSAQQ